VVGYYQFACCNNCNLQLKPVKRGRVKKSNKNKTRNQDDDDDDDYKNNKRKFQSKKEWAKEQ